MHSATFGQKPNTAYQHKQTVKRCGGGVMIWACFAATGPGPVDHELLCKPK